MKRVWVCSLILLLLMACSAPETPGSALNQTQIPPTDVAEESDFIREFMRAQLRDDPRLDQMVATHLSEAAEAVESLLSMSDMCRRMNIEVGWDTELYNADQFLQAAEKLSILYGEQTGDLAPQEKVNAYKLRVRGMELGNEGYDLISSDPRAALTKMYEALELFRSANAPVDEAKAMLNIAVAYTRLEEYDEAINYYEQARVLFEQENDYSFAVNCLMNLTFLYTYQEQPEKGKDSARRALDIALASGDDELVSKVKEELADFLDN